ncbi:MAG TPA: nuclear transport factor 2 family protein [Acidimicrobiales bacterium]|nr:nuclear transport factor 2 family protein [Acidimicrobiales bacterium]
MSEEDPAALSKRLASLEARVRALEDQAAVLRLVCSWGPAVDSGDSEAASGLWDERGVLESDLSRLEGPAAVAAMVQSAGQQALIRQGCAHVQTAPIVDIVGDDAVVTTYSQVFLHGEEAHEVWRVSANRWECRRTPAGWRLTRRVNRVIDGSSAPRELLANALSGDASERRPGPPH